MNPTVKVTVKNKGAAGKVKDRLKELSNTQVLVGIPQKTTLRKGGIAKINNAELVYIHTHGVRSVAMRAAMKPNLDKGMKYPVALQLYLHSKGSPEWQVPPRPIIEPAITASGNREKIEAELKEAAKAALAGKKALMMNFFKRAGLTAQNLVKAWFTDPRNHWPPNSPATIKRKGSDKPLIDTGAMRNAITYVVRTK